MSPTITIAVEELRVGMSAQIQECLPFWPLVMLASQLCNRASIAKQWRVSLRPVTWLPQCGARLGRLAMKGPLPLVTAYS
jgi:hypothetical protein